MSELLSAELVATCNSLGYSDIQNNRYHADVNTLETVKDLIRYLRRDDETHDIRRQLGKIKVVQTDLLPLLKNYHEEEDLFDVLLRLLVNMTTPALMLYNEEVPTERTARNHFLKLDEQLRLYKQAFADEAIWAVLSSRISKILELDSVERSDENGLIMERILILIRNVLYVPADQDAEKRPDNDASVHDEVLWALHQSGLLDIVLYMTSTSTEQAYYMHILEILSLMFREQTAGELANAALQRSENEKLRDEAELLSIRFRETNAKQKKVKKYSGARHSRFGGTYVVTSLKSTSDNDLLYHKPLDQVDVINFDLDKNSFKTPKNRRPVQTQNTERRSAFSIRLFLKEFCVEFLNASYNSFMRSAKNRLARSRAQQHDESYYLWAMRFFMEFNRINQSEVKLVSETMSVQSFHFVQQQMENYFDMLTSDKKKIRHWSRRLHLALLSYKELLQTITIMDKSPDEDVQSSARVIKSNVFYVLEYRELVLTLLVTYDELKLSKSYLKDLLETQHIFLKMLQLYCGGKSGRVVVQGKNRIKKKKQKVQKITSVPFDLNNLWDEAAQQVSTVLQEGKINDEMVPFDATLDIPIDEQKDEAMRNIQRKLRLHEFEAAVGLLRAAREVWPEGECFGVQGMPQEEEFLALKDIFFADLGENKPPQEEKVIEEEDYEEDEEDELEAALQISESDLKFEDFAKRLAHPKIVRACGLALADFDTNSSTTNVCIVKLLHRIAFDCKMSAMLFQLSIFCTFRRIFEMKHLTQYKELVKFAIYVIREFVKVTQNNPHVFMETLFWKSARDAYDIEEGYGSYHEKSQAAQRGWTEAQEDELRVLFMEHREKQLEEDVVDWIVENLVDDSQRTRRGVMKKLKEMHLLIDYKGNKKGKSAGGAWGLDEEEQLRELFEEFKDSADPLGFMMERLDVKRSKNRIIEKLLVMGLVQDRKELWKKRKSAKSGQTGNDSSDEVNSGGSDGEKTKSVTNKTKAKSRGGKKISKKILTKSVGELSKLLVNLVDDGRSEAIEWIIESFNETADDLENGDEDDEGVPLVPIGESAVSAMENLNFLEMLRGVGVQEPASEQESYWRIPSNLTAQTLRSHTELFNRAINKTLIIEETSANQSSDEDVFDTLRKFKETQLSTGTSENPNSSGVFEELKRLTENPSLAKEEIKIKVPKVKKTRGRILQDSSDEEEITLWPGDLNEENRLSFKPKRILDDQDSDESNPIPTKRNFDSDEETKLKPFKSARVIESSDSENEEVEEPRGKRTRSDSDSDDTNKEPNVINDINPVEGAHDDNLGDNFNVKDDNVKDSVEDVTDDHLEHVIEDEILGKEVCAGEGSKSMEGNKSQTDSTEEAPQYAQVKIKHIKKKAKIINTNED